MRVEPVESLKGEVAVPGDKSISHRYAILGAMATGKTTIANFSTSKDCTSTLLCLRKLGVKVVCTKSQVTIHSRGWNSLQCPDPELDVGNSGTTIRLLSALLAARPMLSTIAGDESINRRPMRRIIDPLTLMGAHIQARDNQFPPLKIRGTKLTAIRYKLPVASAQVKSCVLLAGLTAHGRTVVIEETPSRDHTERALPWFGASFHKEGSELSVTGPAELSPTHMKIPSDLSSAIFLVLAALLVKDSRIRIPSVGVNPTRAGLLSLLEQSGAQIERERLSESNSEPSCNLTVSYNRRFLEAFPSEIKGRWIPNVIDEIPVLAVMGTLLTNGLAVRDAQELRKKESDRIKSIVTNLRRVGVEVTEYPDGFRIPPGQQIRGGTVTTFSDHRIAMAFAVAGLLSSDGVEIDDPGCADVSFPGFFSALSSLTR